MSLDLQDHLKVTVIFQILTQLSELTRNELLVLVEMACDKNYSNSTKPCMQLCTALSKKVSKIYIQSLQNNNH